MSKRLQVHLASIALSLAIALVACFLLLTFYVPHLTAVWEDTNRALAVWERILVTLSQAAQAAGWPALALFIIMLLATLAWRLFAQLQFRRSVA